MLQPFTTQWQFGLHGFNAFFEFSLSRTQQHCRLQRFIVFSAKNCSKLDGYPQFSEQTIDDQYRSWDASCRQPHIGKVVTRDTRNNLQLIMSCYLWLLLSNGIVLIQLIQYSVSLRASPTLTCYDIPYKEQSEWLYKMWQKKTVLNSCSFLHWCDKNKMRES